MIKDEAKVNVDAKGGVAFVKAVAKYFMDFLETDFHKRRIPKRNVKLHSAENLLIGLNLNKYPSFNKLIWKLVNKSFEKNILQKVGKGVYKADIPKNLLDLITLQAKKISDRQVKQVVKKISTEITNATVLYKKEYSRALSVSLEEASKLIQKELVLPFVNSIEKSLEQMELGDENTIYIIEEELSSVFLKLLEDKIAESLKILIAGDKLSLNKELEFILNPKDVRSTIISFFEDFKVTDLFNEVYEMERNRNILDKQEFYLYFFDITFDRVKYPIFYIPFSIDKVENGFGVNFDAQVYINKKALEYVVQEYNKNKEKRGNLKGISERIIYLAQHQEDFSQVIKSIVDEIINFFELDKEIDISNADPQASKNFLVRISNATHICLFDKSDEALVNDYEEIIELLDSGDNIIATAFNKLIDDFIHKDPVSYIDEVQDEWDETETSDKLVIKSPIPLNSEQRQVLTALNKDDCKYITVEGPPGTGKSHTITALVFDAILKNKSVLVLSDKKEALDVVEDKITETMNKVRHDENFQNPILRLGKTGSTYSQILSTTSIENIRTNYKAVKKDYEKLEENIDKNINTLKEDLDAEIVSYKNIDINEVHEFIELEDLFQKEDPKIDLEELTRNSDSAFDLEELRRVLQKINLQILENDLSGFRDTNKLEEYINFIEAILGVIENLKTVYGQDLELLSSFSEFSDEDLPSLKKIMVDYGSCKHWLFGYILVKNKLIALDLEFTKKFPLSNLKIPHEQLKNIDKIVEIFEYSNDLGKKLGKQFVDKIDYLRFIHRLVFDEAEKEKLKNLLGLKGDIKYLESNNEKYPKSFEKLKIAPEMVSSLRENNLLKMSDIGFDHLLKYLTLKQKLNKEFGTVPLINYVGQKKSIEELVTTQMTYLMDKRVTNFYDNNRATAKALREIIRTKRRFPRNEFMKLKEAFPCILSGIRDYAEYIPLDPEIFDLLIIDEASQVSIAQSFPALLRAKKIVILGDRKQFSNIKSVQARSETNKEYLNNLESEFTKRISADPSKLVRLEKFNIKTSILEFLEYITNYNARLLKHFRGYKEIISYSNKFFYQDTLQVMKIRGKPLKEVLVFDFIKHDGKEELVPNTNMMEAEFIIAELKKLKDSHSNSSVGIITPHTNQQKLLIEKIILLPEHDYLFDTMKLKIMTFDTCQGEERDIIFYSMVATEENDHLWGVFIKDLTNIDLEEDGVIRAQRLNVGFSRARERIDFVLSKPLDKYSGSIGEALRHYSNVLEEGKKEPTSKDVDPKSPMEKEILQLITQTKFYRENMARIELKTQFHLGSYLKQLDKSYNHPMYVVDFLILYTDEKSKNYKIVVEYDGFEFHFKNRSDVTEYNYDFYYNDDDVYRAKVLESYGCKVIKINKFNLGKDKISSLDEKISAVLKETQSSDFLSGIYKTIENLQNGDMKECPKCGEIRKTEDFKDSSLIKGFGRFCRFCKGKVSYSELRESLTTSAVNEVPGSVSPCPVCNARMILRSGRYGKFYGCSRFPYCRGTRPYRTN
jgi:superfamily I DNA and/or RNA helicase